MKIQIKNKWSNHTGISAANLAFNNDRVMWRYYKRMLKTEPEHNFTVEYTGLENYRELVTKWMRANRKRAIKYFFTGWFHKNALSKCKLVIR